MLHAITAYDLTSVPQRSGASYEKGLHMTRTQKALAALIIKIDAGSEIWDVINRIAETHNVSRKALLAAYDKSQQ